MYVDVNDVEVPRLSLSLTPPKSYLRQYHARRVAFVLVVPVSSSVASGRVVAF